MTRPAPPSTRPYRTQCATAPVARILLGAAASFGAVAADIVYASFATMAQGAKQAKAK
jgi:hypothetical protein